MTDADVQAFREDDTREMSPERRRATFDRFDRAPVKELFPACSYSHHLLGGALRVGADRDVWVR